MTQNKKRLGELLFQAGLITEVQLGAALADQQSWGGRLGTHLVRMGFITERQLIDFLSSQLDIAKINFHRSKIDVKALEKVPKQLALKYNVIPVAIKEDHGRKKLLIATADPTNVEAVSEIEFATGAAVITVLAMESEITHIIAFCYGDDKLRDNTALLEDGKKKVIEYAPRSENDLAVILAQDGREMMVGMNERNATNLGLRALINLLVKKEVITLDEFHDALQESKASLD